jgi:hypothetical protein
MQKLLRHAMHVLLPGQKGAWLQESTAVPAAMQIVLNLPESVKNERNGQRI